MSDKQNQSSHELACWIAQVLDKKGGKQISVLDVREVSSITDFLVIGTGTSLKTVETLVTAPSQELKKSGFPANSIEGSGSHWVVADYGDVFLHVFDEAARSHFDLEGLWKTAPRVEWEPKKLQLRSIAF